MSNSLPPVTTIKQLQYWDGLEKEALSDHRELMPYLPMPAYCILLATWHARGKREAGTEAGNTRQEPKCVGMVILAQIHECMKHGGDFPAGASSLVNREVYGVAFCVSHKGSVLSLPPPCSRLHFLLGSVDCDRVVDIWPFSVLHYVYIH